MKPQIKLEVTLSLMKNQITCPGQQGTRKWENQTRIKWKFMKDKTDKNQTRKELFWYKKNEIKTRMKDKIIFQCSVVGCISMKSLKEVSRWRWLWCSWWSLQTWWSYPGIYNWGHMVLKAPPRHPPITSLVVMSTNRLQARSSIEIQKNTILPQLCWF